MTTKINGTTGVTAAKFTAGDATSVASFGRCLIQDRKTAATGGGASVAGFQVRDLNTLLVNDISATLSGNTFTLQPGSYWIEASAPAYAVGTHKCFIATSAAPTVAVLLGSTEYAHALNEVPSNRSFVSGRLVVTVTTSYVLGHYTSTARGGNGLGVATGALAELYSSISITREA